MVSRSVAAALVSVLGIGVLVVILAVSFTTTPQAILVSSQAGCSNAAAGVAIKVKNSSITRYISPDPADTGFTQWTLSVELDLTGVTLDPAKLVLDVIPKYRTHWKDQLVGKGGFDASGKLTLTGSAPTLPGFYEKMPVYVTYDNGAGCAAATVSTFNVSIDVTCSATLLDSGWCDGERRWIPATSKCVRTYKPCGQETAVGVAETDKCKVYECFEKTKTCGRTPIGKNCIDCYTVGEVCIPNCKNEDNTTRVCGDDGCGGVCGTFGQGNGCDPADPQGNISCDAATGTCVPATHGSCQQPYPLFGRRLKGGDALLNPYDPQGIEYWMLNNKSPDTTEPVVSIDATGALPADWPSDGVTVPKGGIRVRVKYNSTYYSDTVTSGGNAVGTPDVTFTFTIPNGTAYQGLDAYLVDGTGDISAYSMDMYLSLVKENCESFAYGDPYWSPADVYDNDDAAPPGGFGSHIYSTGLGPGTYKIVGSHYAAQSVGYSWLEVVFTDATMGGACTPICVGHTCGNNGCGGVCNVQWCDNGLTCNKGRCSHCGPEVPLNCERPGQEDFPEPYNDPNKTFTSECGFDVNNCGEPCGIMNGGCPPGELCSYAMGICYPVPTCDRNVPECHGTPPAKKKKRGVTQAPQHYCNVFCEWQEINDPLPDIVPNEEAWVKDSFTMQWKLFDDLSCAIEEKCVFGQGNRLIVRFNTDIFNIGNKVYKGENVFTRPDILEFASCHQHPHLKGFAQFNFGNENGTTAIESGKQSYCVESTGQYQTGPKVPCSSDFGCGNQGLEPGTFDRYDAYLDCQWLDVTKLVENHDLNRWFMYLISVNNGRPIIEYSYLNNAAVFPVFLPCPPSLLGFSYLAQLPVNDTSLCCSRPGGPDPVNCPNTNCGSKPAPDQSVCDYNLHLIN